MDIPYPNPLTNRLSSLIPQPNATQRQNSTKLLRCDGGVFFSVAITDSAFFLWPPHIFSGCCLYDVASSSSPMGAWG